MPDPRERVSVDIEFHGMAATHNLLCWLCQERPAVYEMNPVWVFTPCWECSAEIGGRVVRKRENWVQRLLRGGGRSE